MQILQKIFPSCFKICLLNEIFQILNTKIRRVDFPVKSYFRFTSLIFYFIIELAPFLNLILHLKVTLHPKTNPSKNENFPKKLFYLSRMWKNASHGDWKYFVIDLLQAFVTLVGNILLEMLQKWDNVTFC